MPVAAVMETLLLYVAQNVTVTDLPSEMDNYKDVDTQHLATQLQMVPELVRTFNERNPASAIK